MIDRPYRPPLRKRVLKSATVRGTFTFLIACTIRLIFATSRKELILAPGAMLYMRSEKPSIVCCWHGRMLFMPLSRAMTVLW